MYTANIARGDTVFLKFMRLDRFYSEDSESTAYVHNAFKQLEVVFDHFEFGNLVDSEGNQYPLHPPQSIKPNDHIHIYTIEGVRKAYEKTLS